MSNKSKVAIWIVIGALAGFAFGALTQHIVLLTGIGIVIGVAVGLASTRMKMK